MKHIVKFSGGAASALVASLVAEKHGSETILLYHDTKTEPADNDRFRREVAAHLNLPITEVSDGRNIWQLFEDKGFVGNNRITPCSEDLKQKLGDAYIKNNLPATVYFGFTVEEHLRAQRTAIAMQKIGAVAEFPLIKNRIGKDQCLRTIQKCWGIKLPDMYAWAEHANCVPCVKGGLEYWGLVFLHAPEAWHKAASVEDATGEQILKNTRYGTLREELDHCLVLVAKRMAASADKRAALYETPCECSTA